MPTKTDSLRYDIGELMKSGSFHEIVDRCHVELTMARREQRFSVEIIALLGLAQAQCSLGHFDFARDYSNQAIELAQQIRSIGLMVDGLLARARVSREGYFQTIEAHDDYRAAVDHTYDAGDMRRYGQSLLGLGEISSNPGDASKHAWKVIDIARELNDASMEARAILMLSNAFIRAGQYGKANDGLLVALQKAKSNRDRLLESIIIGQQGLVLAQDSESFQRGFGTAVDRPGSCPRYGGDIPRIHAFVYAGDDHARRAGIRRGAQLLRSNVGAFARCRAQTLRDVYPGHAWAVARNATADRKRSIILWKSRRKSSRGAKPGLRGTLLVCPGRRSTRLSGNSRPLGVTLARRARSISRWTMDATQPGFAPPLSTVIFWPSLRASCA